MLAIPLSLVRQVIAAAEAPMPLLGALGCMVGALLLLGFGADSMVRGASSLALRLRLTPAVIGLTVVALGTSLPELVVSVAAQIDGIVRQDPSNQALAWGNVVGSNIFNIGLVLGLAPLFRPLSISGSTVRLEYPFMVAAGFLTCVFLRDSGSGHVLDRVEGTFFLVAFLLFTVFVIRLARREVNRREAAELDAAVSEFTGDPSTPPRLGKPLFEVLLGTICLAIGGELLILGAKSLALHAGLTHRQVSTVVVAALTGFPELMTTLVAVVRRKADLAVANVVGSNIFNTLTVLGCAACIVPLRISPQGLLVDLSFMLGISVLLGPLLLGRRIYRWEAIALLTVYTTYAVVLFARAED